MTTRIAFPWDKLAPGSLLVDVGGGIGSASMLVAKAHPHIRIIVEDRLPVVDSAHTVCIDSIILQCCTLYANTSWTHSLQEWGSGHKPLIQSGRVSWRYRDFFAPWLPVSDDKVPDVFLLRLVLHDWPDEDARK